MLKGAALTNRKTIAAAAREAMLASADPIALQICRCLALSARPMPPAPPPQTYRVKSFGCQMNVYDGERMAELLGAAGDRASAGG